MALATISDLDARKVEYQDQAQAQAAIDDASAAVGGYLRKHGFDVDEATAEQSAAIKAVTVGIVRRLLTNPRQLMQESLGDYSYSIGGTSGGSRRPTPTERKELREALGLSGAGSIAQTSDLPAQRSEI